MRTGFSLFLVAGLGWGCADIELKQRPVIAALVTDLARISDVEQATFTALVGDPQGLADVAGGTLREPDEGAEYGDFERIDDGTWALTLAWPDISDVRGIEFEVEGTRAFEAVFVDGEGHESKPATTDLSFYCPGGQPTAEPGVCAEEER